jgi:phage portal protein BeeE
VTGYQVGEKLAGYLYRSSPQDPGVFYDPTQIAHYKPYPDRLNRFVGMSWLNPCLPDVEADVQITAHKRTTLTDGAQIPYVVTFDRDISKESFLEFVANYRTNHEGASNAGKTLFLGPGSDLKTVGQTFENLAIKATQGAGETRIAADAGVPPIIVGLSEGLEAATYSNYGQARRAFIDATLRPLWRFFASALQSVVEVPAGARLWYDDRDIPFLREDLKDVADISQTDAITTKAYIDAGFHPDAVIDAVTARDLRRLTGQHSGLYSVQLQPPGTATPGLLPAV